MTGFNDRFGGSSVQAAQVAYLALAIDANVVLSWPQYATNSSTVAARIIDGVASAGSLTVTMPDAREVSEGQDIFWTNRGSLAFSVLDNAGNVIAVLSPGQIRYFYLTDNNTQGGTWVTVLFGAVASTIDASQLQGYGLRTINSTLNQDALVSPIGGSASLSSTDRTSVIVWTGGAGTLTLPLTAGVPGWFIELRNQGTGAVVLTPQGGETIDSSATISLNINESCFVHAGTGVYYTVGRGRNTNFNFTQLQKTVTGGTSTLSLTEAANVVQTYSGALLSNQIVVVPSVVQIYYVSNQCSGAFSFTVQTSTPGTTVVIPANTNVILFCDGVNVINCSNSIAGITALILSAGSAASPSLGIGSATTGLYSSGGGETAITSVGVKVGNFDAQGLKTAPTTGAASNRTISVNAGASNIIDRPVAALGSLTYRTSGLDRWHVEADSDAESGANAGSTFRVRGYNDAGALLGTYLSIARATGILTSNGYTPSSAGDLLPKGYGDTTYATLVSPAFTGIPTAPTAAPGTVTTQLATTAFAAALAFSAALPAQAGNAGKFVTTDGTTARWSNVAGSDYFAAQNFGGF